MLTVALLVSAWIEICPVDQNFRNRAGRTPRECVDWNFCSSYYYNWYGSSHSSWVRGLKCLQRCRHPYAFVALLVSAWIEIKQSGQAWPITSGRTPRECVDWTSDERKQPFFITSHTSWVRGLKSHHKSERSWWRWSHSLWVRGLKLAYFIRQLQLFWFTWEHNLLLDYVPVCNAFVLFYYTLQNK